MTGAGSAPGLLNIRTYQHTPKDVAREELSMNSMPGCTTFLAMRTKTEMADFSRRGPENRAVGCIQIERNSA
jgi:hypothetical protein